MDQLVKLHSNQTQLIYQSSTRIMNYQLRSKIANPIWVLFFLLLCIRQRWQGRTSSHRCNVHHISSRSRTQHYRANPHLKPLCHLHLLFLLILLWQLTGNEYWKNKKKKKKKRKGKWGEKKGKLKWSGAGTWLATNAPIPKTQKHWFLTPDTATEMTRVSPNGS